MCLKIGGIIPNKAGKGIELSRVLNGFTESIEWDHGTTEFVGEVIGCFSCLCGGRRGGRVGRVGGRRS